MEMFPASFKPSSFFFVWNPSRTGIRGQKPVWSSTGPEKLRNLGPDQEQQIFKILDQVGPILIRSSHSFVIP